MLLLSIPVLIYVPYGASSELTLSNPVVGEGGFSSPVAASGVYTLGAAYSSLGYFKSYWMVSIGKDRYTVFIKGNVFMDSSDMLNAAGEVVGTMSAGSYSAGAGATFRFPFGELGLAFSYYGTWIAHSSSGTATVDLGFNKDMPSIGMKFGVSILGLSAPFSYYEGGESYFGLPAVSLGAVKDFSGFKGIELKTGVTLGYEGTFKGAAFGGLNYSGATLLLGGGWKDGVYMGAMLSYASVGLGFVYDLDLGSILMVQIGGKF